MRSPPSTMPRVGELAGRALFAALTVLTGATTRAAEPPPSFAEDIRPLFQQHCIKCHGPQKQRGGLRLDNPTDAFTPGDSGDPAIVPHAPESSLLLTLIKAEDESERMPQSAGPLPSDEIALIERWIVAGAPWPKDDAAAAGRPELIVTQEDRQHWAFRPLRPVEPPPVNDAAWARTPIDRFILAALEAKGLKPSPAIDPRREVRRVSFDLIGLPPSPAALDRFADEIGKDSGRGPATEAYASLVDELLSSSDYGERWARVWLDAARYADSNGYENDLDQPNSWRYRDFVIRAFNEDMPYDRFVQWQLAGDELAPDDPEALIATGFLALGPHATTQPTDLPANRAKVRYDDLDDIVSTTGAALLALTVGCARCHDHKYDAIPARDYYSLVGAFAGSEHGDFSLVRAQRERERWMARQHAARRELKMAELNVPEDDREVLRFPRSANSPTSKAVYEQWGGKLEISDADMIAGLSDELRLELEALDRRRAAGGDSADRALALLDTDSVPATNWLLLRGDPMQKAEEIPAAFLQVLGREDTAERFMTLGRQAAEQRGLRSTGQRTALAKWLTDPREGAGALMARVIVNRLWQAHFGEGLVRTPNNFGVQGEEPSHPELLDWLAQELIRSGWRLKHIQRLIVTSAVYRQSSGPASRDARSLDPDNRLLSRRRPQRLDADALRDSLLAVSGVLNDQAAGPSFKPPIPAEAIATRTRDKYPVNVEDGPEVWRRSIYAFIKRSVRFPFAEVFDAPDPTASCGRRILTTVPTQQLALLNDDFVRRRARDFSGRLRGEAYETDERIRLGFQLALARAPQPGELALSREFLEEQSARNGSSDTALTDWCHALFTLNEFIYVD